MLHEKQFFEFLLRYAYAEANAIQTNCTDN